MPGILEIRLLEHRPMEKRVTDPLRSAKLAGGSNSGLFVQTLVVLLMSAMKGTLFCDTPANPNRRIICRGKACFGGFGDSGPVPSPGGGGKSRASAQCC